jgi:hypothetical protein
MKITGHSAREMFDRYNSVDVEDLSEAVGKMGRLLSIDSDFPATKK